MKVWLIIDGEPLPIDGNNIRLLRMAMLAEMFVARGHEVVFWTSTHDHYKKIFRAQCDKDVSIKPSYKIKMLHGCGYKRNRSLNRILHHRQIAKKFVDQSLREEKPDIILCALPTIEFARAAVEYGQKHQVPVVLDLRDMWPDVYVELFPVLVRWLARMVFHHQFKMMRLAAKKATALVGITQPFLDWGLKYAGRNQNEFDAIFPMGYRVLSFDEHKLKETELFWAGQGIKNGDCIITFVGSLAPTHQLAPVIEALKTVENVKLVVAGEGGLLTQYKQQAAGFDHIVFPGWINAAQIAWLLNHSFVGVAPYIDRPYFQLHITNKPVEYLSAGLPVMTSVSGVLKELLEKNFCGIHYDGESVASFLDAFNRLKNDIELQKQMSKNAKKLYEREFNADVVYAAMCDHLERVSEAFRLQK
jgi:glycosyltransferase involved in cell wall biosynthesis